MGHIGYGPRAEDIRAERGLPYATGADEPPDWHNHPGMTGPDDRGPDQPDAQPETRPAA
jgi:hypothetical protein